VPLENIRLLAHHSFSVSCVVPHSLKWSCKA